MFTVTIHAMGEGHVVEGLFATSAGQATTEDAGPSPIAPEVKELAWGAGSFVVLFVVMRLFLFPRLKNGMNARYGKIRDDHEAAEATRAAALTEVADYQRELAAIKAEAAQRVDAARRTVEAERAAAFAEVNERIAADRAASAKEAEVARNAAAQHIKAAVADVSSRAAQLATGRLPDAGLVDQAVTTVMGADR